MIRRVRGQRHAMARSRITNGKELLPGVDGRSKWARRFRDLVELYTEDLGGSDELSEGKKGLIRRVATLAVQLERMESNFAEADGDVIGDQLELYSRLSKSERLLRKELGLERKHKDSTPSPLEYAQQHRV